MELGLVNTDELLRELFRRYDHAVFSGIKELQNEPDLTLETARRWTGNLVTCEAIAHNLSHTLAHELDDYMEEIE